MCVGREQPEHGCSHQLFQSLQSIPGQPLVTEDAGDHLETDAGLQCVAVLALQEKTLIESRAILNI
jgi:hypothetical protein